MARPSCKGWNQDTRTDSSGSAELGEVPAFGIITGITVSDEKFGMRICSEEAVHMIDIAAHGIALKNDCGAIKITPTPGEIVIFVRP
jgi:hypothetical protein